VATSQRRPRSADDPVVIKKYANRRLYNTAKSSYVTLDDLSRMVRAGEDFQVFDAKTGEDITRSVLAQIIFEQEAKGEYMLPTKFLRQLIRLYGGAMQGFVPGYLDAAMETFARNQEKMRDAFANQQAMATFEAMARSNMEWFEQAMKMFSGLGGRPGGAAPGSERDALGDALGDAPGRPGAPPADVGGDLEALQRQLAEMKAQLDRLSEASPARAGGAGSAAGEGEEDPAGAEDDPAEGSAPARNDATAGGDRGRG